MLIGSSSLPAIAASNANRLISFCVASICVRAGALFGSSFMTCRRAWSADGAGQVELKRTRLLEVDKRSLGLQNGEVGNRSSIVSLNKRA